MLSDRKFNEDSKNVLKNMIRSLQVGFTGNLVVNVALMGLSTVYRSWVETILRWAALNFPKTNIW